MPSAEDTSSSSARESAFTLRALAARFPGGASVAASKSSAPAAWRRAKARRCKSPSCLRAAVRLRRVA